MNSSLRYSSACTGKSIIFLKSRASTPINLVLPDEYALSDLGSFSIIPRSPNDSPRLIILIHLLLIDPAKCRATPPSRMKKKRSLSSPFLNIHSESANS